MSLTSEHPAVAAGSARDALRSARGRAWFRIAAVVGAVALAACGGKEEAPPPPKAAAVDSQVARVDTCPGDGLWRPCVVTERIKRLGFDPKVIDTDTTRVAGITPPGLHYQIGKSGLLIAFYFPDTASAGNSWMALDTTRLMPSPDTTKGWPSRPLAIRSGNLIAAFFGSSATQIERISFALGAGVPVGGK
ncbi:MAG: hypothetical protein ACO1Q7_18530 [Gemmatimonas sp.]